MLVVIAERIGIVMIGLQAIPLPGCYREDSITALVGAPAWIVFGLLGAWIATSKGRGGCKWFLLCSILGPIGLIIAAVISKAD